MNDLMPDKYKGIPDHELIERISRVKEKYGPELFILTHHYQRQEIIDLGDASGDSYGLSNIAAKNQRAKYIVFCGVHFMAESAAILARGEQAVLIPEISAGCPMADMAKPGDVEKAWKEMGEVVDVSLVTPITYVNSSAEVKAFCGSNHGATCTSSNSDKLFDWAFGQREKIFFLPDEHLGRNTAHKMSIDPVVLWDPEKPFGGLSMDEIRDARVIVWKGFCHVHTVFTREQVKEMRRGYPGCKVIVHPECPREVVEAADTSGSTSGIINYVAEQPEGSVIIVGTEINLVQRLARQYQEQKIVVPLSRSLCPNMYKINLHNLCWVLEGIELGPGDWPNQVVIPDDLKKHAALALRRMLDNTG